MQTLAPREQVEILKRQVCHCGRGKKRGDAFCHRCWNRLSQEARDAIYTRIPGFGESYGRALEELRSGEKWSSPRYQRKARRAAAGGEQHWYGE